MNINEAIEQLKYYQNKPYVPTVRKVCDIVLETIEALQQENEQLQAQVARVREVLQKAREAIEAAWSDGSANAAMDKASEALAEIDKAIGGKEDV
jgi:cell division septum initiation protein DivIVA